MTEQTVTLRIRTDASGGVSGVRLMGREVDGLRGEARRTTNEFDRMSTSVREAGNVIRTALGAAALRELSQMADAYTDMNSRLQLVTHSEQQYAAAQDQTYAIAQRTYSGLESTAALYGKMQTATDALGRSQADALRVTELIAKSFGISGAEAAAMDGSIRQLAQGLGSGALRGDELNSVLENAPRLADALRTSLKMNTGELRAFAEQGGITSQIIIDSLMAQGDAIDAEFAQLRVTGARAWQQLENAALVSVGKISAQIGASKTLA